MNKTDLEIKSARDALAKQWRDGRRINPEINRLLFRCYQSAARKFEKELLDRLMGNK